MLSLEMLLFLYRINKQTLYPLCTELGKLSHWTSSSHLTPGKKASKHMSQNVALSV